LYNHARLNPKYDLRQAAHFGCRPRSHAGLSLIYVAREYRGSYGLSVGCRFEPLAAATSNSKQRQAGSILASCRAGNTAARTPPNLTTLPHSRSSQSIKKNELIAVYVTIVIKFSHLKVQSYNTYRRPPLANIKQTDTSKHAQHTGGALHSLTFRRLMSTIVDVPHRESPKLHFIYLFNKYRYRIF